MGGNAPPFGAGLMLTETVQFNGLINHLEFAPIGAGAVLA